MPSNRLKGFIGRVHWNLVVPRKRIHETQDFITRCSVDQQIYVREGICILRTMLVKVCIVGTHPPLPICLLDHHYDGLPGWVFYFPNELCLEEPVCFNFNSPPLFFSHLPLSLRYWHDVSVNR